MESLVHLNAAIQIAANGKVGEFATMIGARQTAVSNWRSRLESGEQKVVPAEWCPSIELATGGKVRCEQLNPNVEWSVLRGKRGRRSAA